MNHVTTGGVIGLAIATPLALPIAFGSHYLLDAIPHFGNHPSWEGNDKKFWAYVVSDGLLTALMFIILWNVSSGSWLVVAAGFLAASPDLVHLLDRLGKYIKPSFDLIGHDPTFSFHKNIQKSETPRGAFVEIAWLGLMAWAIVTLV